MVNKIITFQTSDGSVVYYRNFKSENNFGNCAYMFTTTGIGAKGKWGDTTCAINSVMRYS